MRKAGWVNLLETGVTLEEAIDKISGADTPFMRAVFVPELRKLKKKAKAMAKKCKPRKK